MKLFSFALNKFISSLIRLKLDSFKFLNFIFFVSLILEVISIHIQLKICKDNKDHNHFKSFRRVLDAKHENF